MKFNSFYCWIIKLSKALENLPLSAFVKTLFLPFKNGSNDLRSDIKSLVAKIFPMFVFVKINPSFFKTIAPLSMQLAANGMSEVTTISSTFTLVCIHLSASSGPQKLLLIQLNYF